MKEGFISVMVNVLTTTPLALFFGKKAEKQIRYLNKLFPNNFC